VAGFVFAGGCVVVDVGAVDKRDLFAADEADAVVAW
jgi:hypothetical protein